MSTFGFLLFSVTGVVVVALIAAALLGRRTSAFGRLVVAAIVAFALLSVYAVDYVLGRPLVAGYHPFSRLDVPEGRTAIVLLGAGPETAVDWSYDHVSVAGPLEAARTLEAARVFRMMPQAVVISSGGPAGLPYDSSAETMKRLLLRLGVPESQIVLEPTSRTTHDEAVLIRPMIDRLGVDHVVLVTSDVHMRRSMATFRRAGMEAIPAIARDPRSVNSWFFWLLPTSGGLTYASLIMHEYAGLVVYGARGWLRFDLW